MHMEEDQKENITISHAGIINGFKTLADRTIKFSISCQEMTPDQLGKMVSMNENYVKFIVTNKEVLQDDIIAEIEKMPVKNNRSKYSKSQILRFNLKKLWEFDDRGMDWDKFYDYYMDWMIDIVSKKIS